MQLGRRRLAGYAQDRNGVGAGRVKAGDHVGTGRARGAQAHADIARFGTGVALGHVGGALHVARQHVIHAADLAHGRIKGVDRRTGQAERHVHTLFLEHVDGGFSSSHLSHLNLSSVRHPGCLDQQAPEPLDKRTSHRQEHCRSRYGCVQNRPPDRRSSRGGGHNGIQYLYSKICARRRAVNNLWKYFPLN